MTTHTGRATLSTTFGLLAMLTIAGCHGATGTPSSAPPNSRHHVYTTKSFTVPFTVTVPANMPVEAAVDQPNFVTWGWFKSKSESEPAIRIMAPVSVFPPGNTTPTAPPANYLQYLHSLTAAGARFSDETTLTVDGHPATILTATATDGVVLDGAVGCPVTETNAKNCFALESTLVLRLTVIDLGSTGTLVAWMRTGTGSTEQASEFHDFEQMLSTIRFTNRPAQTATAPPTATSATRSPSIADPRLPEGTYSTGRLTLEQLVTAGLRVGLTRAQVEQAYGGNASASTEFSIKIQAGQFTQLESRDGGPLDVGFSGTYQIADDHTLLVTDSCAGCGVTSFTYNIDPAGLHLQIAAQPQQSCQGDVGCLFGYVVFQTAPFRKTGQ